MSELCDCPSAAHDCRGADNCRVTARFSDAGMTKALLEANRKQVLLEAANMCQVIASSAGTNALHCAAELRRMALEPTGVDKGEKE